MWPSASIVFSAMPLSRCWATMAQLAPMSARPQAAFRGQERALGTLAGRPLGLAGGVAFHVAPLVGRRGELIGGLLRAFRRAIGMIVGAGAVGHRDAPLLPVRTPQRRPGSRLALGGPAAIDPPLRPG